MGGEGRSQLAFAPFREVGFVNRFQRGADAVLGEVHARRGHCENHAGESAPAMLAVHAFAFPDQRFQNFAAARNAFVAFETLRLATGPPGAVDAASDHPD